MTDYYFLPLLASVDDYIIIIEYYPNVSDYFTHGLGLTFHHGN